jgi:VWFA-related protein
MLPTYLRGRHVHLAALASAVLCAGAIELVGQGRAAREQVMFVTVTDGSGVPVKDLRAEDFIVREDGLRREVLRAFAADGPATVALMVDNSTASERFIADIRRAVTGFVERLGGRYPMAVTAVAARPTILQDYTLDKKALLKSVERIFAMPDTASYFLEGLVELSRGLSMRDFERASIVAISAEGPEFSDLHYSQVLPKLRESGAMLDAFLITQQGGADPSEEGSRSRSVLLDRGTRETGGSRSELLTSMALGGALQKLADRLEHQYRVVYSRPESLIPPEKIEVSAAKPGLEARGIPARAPRG